MKILSSKMNFSSEICYQRKRKREQHISFGEIDVNWDVLSSKNKKFCFSFFRQNIRVINNCNFLFIRSSQIELLSKIKYSF
jgi:hypothetical protein